MARVRIRTNIDQLPPDTIRVILVPLGAAATALRPCQVMLDGVPLFDLAPRYPFFDTARELMARGYAPSRTLALVDDHGRVRMAGRLADAATWTISESAAAGPRIVPWRPPPEDLWTTEPDTGDDKSR